MEEVASPTGERSTFAMNDARMSVNCKPKMFYASSATNWANEHLELLPSAEENLIKAIEKAHYLDTYLSEYIEPEVLTEYYQSVCQFFDEFINDLSQLVPLHRPIDIQTSDAGPGGVGTSEKMVRLRQVESCLIHDIDFQYIMHYVPKDSKCHKVEQVMSYLTDDSGDGRHLIPDEIRLLQDLSNGEVINMSVEEQLQYKQKQSKNSFWLCNKSLSTIPGKTSYEKYNFFESTKVRNPYQHFFFDESYLKKFINTSKKNIGDRQLEGYSYFEFLSEKFDEMFIVYDNRVEGIRNDGRFRCPHTVQRIPPLVPDLPTVNDEGVWHYNTSETIPSDVKNTENREINDFNPRKQLHKLIESCGNIDLYNVETVEGSVQLRDKKQNMAKNQ